MNYHRYFDNWANENHDLGIAFSPDLLGAMRYVVLVLWAVGPRPLWDQ